MPLKSHSRKNKIQKSYTSSSISGTVYLTPDSSSRPRRVQPPKTLSLHSKIFVHSPQMENVATKMSSVESIGTCSLNVEGSESSANSELREEYTVSDRTLQSASCVLSSGGSPSQTGLESLKEVDNSLSPSTSEKKRFRTHMFIYVSPEDKEPVTNGHAHEVKEECSVAEIKLPSYVSISCAINGYTNFSRYCRSRDNSPARVAFGKLSPYKGSELNEGNFLESGVLNGRPMDSGDQSSFKLDNSKYSNFSHVYTESKELSIRKQIQVPVKTTKTYMASQEIVIGNKKDYMIEKNKISNNDVQTNKREKIFNGHGDEIHHPLAFEVGDAANTHKSLVQQRIESLYGEAGEGSVKFSYRVNKQGLENSSGRSSRSVISTKRSPSCPPQVTRGQSKSPPVFRHLTKDFREQLKGATFTPSNHNKVQSVKTNIIKSPSPQSPAVELYIRSSSPPSKDTALPTSLSNTEVESFLISSQENATSDGSKSPKSSSPELAFSSQSHPLSSVEEYIPKSSEKGGYRFLSIAEAEKAEIKSKTKELEKELERHDIPEEACGKIRAAVGKANLLMSQKFEQFKDLCNSNINGDPNDPFCTTASDLEGFWDLVLLQVADVKNTFEEINVMKENNWKETAVPKVQMHLKPKRTVVPGTSRSNPTTPKRSTKAEEMARSREQARRQLIAAKRKAKQQSSSQEESEITIFTPDSTN